jgi:hypothetical protein
MKEATTFLTLVNDHWKKLVGKSEQKKAFCEVLANIIRPLIDKPTSMDPNLQQFLTDF